MLRGPALRHVIADSQCRAGRECILLRHSLFFSLSRLRYIGQLRRFARGDAAEVLRYPTLGLCRIEITCNDEHSVAGYVIGGEERTCVLERRGIDVLEIAVEVVRVVPIGVRILRQAQPRKTTV